MIVELLIFVLVVWAIFITAGNRSRLSPVNKFVYLDGIGKQICRQCGYSYPRYSIVESQPLEGSSTIFKPGMHPIIRMCLVDRYGMRFDDDTICIAFIHELAHVLSTDEGHTDGFYEIEDELIGAAQILGYLSETSQVDSYYPCKYD